MPALGNALAGAVGSAVSNVATYPLSVIVARLQAQRQNNSGKKSHEDDEDNENEAGEEEQEQYTGILDAARKLYTKGGIKELYPGLAQDTAKTVADNFLFFLAYSFFRQRRIVARVGAQRAKRRTNVVLPIFDELAIGILAGAFSKLFTTPLANIVTRKQTASGKATTKDIAAKIRSEKGIWGFWSGYSATLILTLNPSITLFLNKVLEYALPREKRAKPSPVTTFLLAALSKAAASSIMYPFSMAKTRAQVQGNTNSNTTSNEKSNVTQQDDSFLNPITPQILSNVLTIARTEGPAALYAGLPGEVLKGFFSHGFTMLAKDAVYSSIVKSYYLLLLILRKYPTPEELIERAREQAEEYAEAAREGAKDLAQQAKRGTEEILESQPGHVAVEATSHDTPSGVDASSGFAVDGATATAGGDSNETAELVGDYVDDEAQEWKGMYRWFGSKLK